MNILFVGKFFPPEMLKTIKEDSKGKVGFSNHNFEMSIVHGLEKQSINFSVLTIPGVYSWPHNNRKLFTHAEHYYEGNASVKSAGFCNVVGLNKVSMLASTLFNLIHIYRQFNGTEIHVITNAPNVFILKALSLSKNLARKTIDVTVIIPDIPSMVTMMHRKEWSIKGWFVDKIDKWTIGLLGKCDKYVLLTEAMTDFFSRPIKYIVMEGLIDVDSYPESHNSSLDKKVILYTGSIHRQFGIMNLVEAFEMANLSDDVELWICGSGDSASDISERTKSNKNIKFFGLVDSERAREMQQRASVLVNPRTSDFEFTKYSFPSKTLEYMMTGRPVIMNRLPGIPTEYFDYVITPEDESINSLSLTLEKVMALSCEERERIGESGRDFVIKAKNADMQMKRVVDFISEK